MTSNDNNRLVRSLGQTARDGEASSESPSAAKAKPDNDMQATDEAELGRLLVARMEEDDYHPVIVFGVSGAGKTTLVASLLAGKYAGAEETLVDISFSPEPLVPLDHPKGQEIWKQTRFFESIVRAFASGKLVQQTRQQYPFFIPIEFTPRSEKCSPAKFAFLEWRGEFLSPEKRWSETDGREYRIRKELPDAVASVLTNFTRPVSVIYVAPYVLRTSDEQERFDADSALRDAVENYQRRRAPSGMSEKDHHLFLLSMWDEKTESIAAEEFTRPHVDSIIGVLDSKFHESWTKYTHTRLGKDGRSYCFMQYSAGPITEDGIARVPSESCGVLNRYPRTIQNWLYGNAMDGAVLFPDVLEQPAPRVTMLDRARGFFGPRAA